MISSTEAGIDEGVPATVGCTLPPAARRSHIALREAASHAAAYCAELSSHDAAIAASSDGDGDCGSTAAGAPEGGGGSAGGGGPYRAVSTPCEAEATTRGSTVRRDGPPSPPKPPAGAADGAIEGGRAADADDGGGAAEEGAFHSSYSCCRCWPAGPTRSASTTRLSMRTASGSSATLARATASAASSPVITLREHASVKPSVASTAAAAIGTPIPTRASRAGSEALRRELDDERDCASSSAARPKSGPRGGEPASPTRVDDCCDRAALACSSARTSDSSAVARSRKVSGDVTQPSTCTTREARAGAASNHPDGENLSIEIDGKPPSASDTPSRFLIVRTRSRIHTDSSSLSPESCTGVWLVANSSPAARAFAQSLPL